MAEDELIAATAASTADLITSGEVSATEVLDAWINRSATDVV